MVWSPDRHSSHEEAAKIAPYIVPYTRGIGVDVGSGPNKVYPHFTTIDSGKDFGGRKVADIRADGTALPMFASRALDFVFSSHFLEHVKDTQACLGEWWRVIKPGGYLVLYLPHKAFYPNIGKPGSNPDHKHDFLPTDIIKAMSKVAQASGETWTLIESEERDGDDEYSFFQVYRKNRDPLAQPCEVRPWERNPQGKKRALVIRYGAFGDAIQASSILPALKAEGYHVTMNVSEKAYDVLRADPHIDDFVLQETNQVPPPLLRAYTLALMKRYDRVINLSEAAEVTILTHPDHVQFYHDDATRRRLYSKANYLERVHEIAGVPYEPRPKFYATKAEAERAAALAASPANAPLLMFVLSGSAIHKTWPWYDIAAAWLLTKSNARIVTVGDERCQLIEQQIALTVMKATGTVPDEFGTLPPERMATVIADRLGEERLLFRSGLMPIRDTMALAQAVDIVIGPETGVLNAVAHEPAVGKIVMLSHSSHDNLTRDWPNTAVLMPGPHVQCYPCLRLHYSARFCHIDEQTVAAMCAAEIEPKHLFAAIAALMEGQGRARSKDGQAGDRPEGTAVPPLEGEAA